jgi:hypothetical protein
VGWGSLACVYVCRHVRLVFHAGEVCTVKASSHSEVTCKIPPGAASDLQVRR